MCRNLLRWRIVWVGILAGVIAAPARADDETSRLLTLVSLAYRTSDGADVPRTHDVTAYEPFLRTGRADVRRVAALSVLWERLAAQSQTPLVGAVPGLVANVLRGGGFDSPEARAFIRDYGSKPGEAGGLFGPLLQDQSQRYQRERLLTQGQTALWDGAEALARRTAGSEGGSGLVVALRTEKGRGRLLTVKNTSSRALQRLTVSARVEKKPIPAAPAGFDQLLGAAAAAQFGGANARGAGDAGSTFAQSVEDYNFTRNAPDRVFLHIARLEPGAEISTPLFPPGAPLNYLRATSATYSAWSDELKVESAPIGGFEPILAENRKRWKQEEERARAAKAQQERNRARYGMVGGAFPRPTPDPVRTRKLPSYGIPPRDPAKMAFTRLQTAEQIARTDPVRAFDYYKGLVRDYPKTPSGQKASEWIADYPELLMDRAEKPGTDPKTAARYYREVLRPALAAPRGLVEKARAKLEAHAQALWDEATRIEARGDRASARTLFMRIRSEAAGTDLARRAADKLNTPQTRTSR